MTRVQLLRAVVTLSASIAATSAFAQERLYAPEQSCERIKGALDQEGALVISTSPSTYDRFVSNGSFCAYNQITKAEWIRSADKRECFIGYTCKERDGTRFN